jgi:DNA-binding NtrC family response regulator
MVLTIPPLRERPEEIVPLMQHFVGDVQLSADVLARLLAYRWPGNVRELRNVAERALALYEGEHIECRDLPLHIGAPEPVQPEPAGAPAQSSDVDLRAILRQQEVSLIKDALQRSNGNQRRAAGLLGLPLRTLERKLRILGLRAHDC